MPILVLLVLLLKLLVLKKVQLVWARLHSAKKLYNYHHRSDIECMMSWWTICEGQAILIITQGQQFYLWSDVPQRHHHARTSDSVLGHPGWRWHWNWRLSQSDASIEGCLQKKTLLPFYIIFSYWFALESLPVGDSRDLQILVGNPVKGSLKILQMWHCFAYPKLNH